VCIEKYAQLKITSVGHWLINSITCFANLGKRMNVSRYYQLMKLALDKRMNDSRYYQLMKLALDKK